MALVSVFFRARYGRGYKIIRVVAHWYRCPQGSCLAWTDFRGVLRRNVKGVTITHVRGVCMGQGTTFFLLTQ